MKYKHYQQGPQLFWGGILLFLLFGGGKLLLLLIPITFVLIIQFFPLILLFFVFRTFMHKFRISHTLKQSAVDHSHFVELLIRILIHPMRADGRIDEREIFVIKDFFRTNMGFSSVKMNWIDDLIQQGIQDECSLEELCQEFNHQFDRQAKLILLQLVYRIVLADDVFSDSEKKVIDRLHVLLHISQEDHDRIRSFFQFSENSDEDFYQILGVDQSASPEEIKKAYRASCKENHPDKVQHLGEEFRQVAEEKMQKINHAYTTLMKQRV